MRGQINYKEGKYKAAIRDYKKALKFNSKDYIAYVGIGDVYLDLKNYDLAMKNYIYFIEITSTHEAYNGKGYIKLAHLNDISGAIEDLTTAINLNPKRDEAYINRGFANLNVKNYEKAIIDFSHAKKLSTKNPDVYFYNALCNIKLNSNLENITSDLYIAKDFYIKNQNIDKINECNNILLKLELKQ